MEDPNLSVATTRHGSGNEEPVRDRSVLIPAVDVFENENEVLMLVDLPGVVTGDVIVRLEDGELFFEARRSAPPPGTPLTTEYRFCDYRGTFLVPQGIDSSRIEAELDNGVLRIRLRKAESLKPRRTDVRTG